MGVPKGAPNLIFRCGWPSKMLVPSDRLAVLEGGAF